MAHKRLNFIVSLISKEEKVLDIGTDHGLVPIFLLDKHKKMTADASDINQNPLNIAIKNIKQHGYEGKINTFLSDGVEDVDITPYTTLVIAGMGGKEISSILGQKNFKGRVILHATQGHELLRKNLKKLGYRVRDEHLVLENKVYNIIIDAKTGLCLFPRPFLGRFLWKKDDDIVQKYLEEQWKYYKHLYNKSKRKEHKKKAIKLEKKLKWRSKNY